MHAIKKTTAAVLAVAAAWALTAIPAEASEPSSEVIKNIRVAALDECLYQAIFLEVNRWKYDYRVDATFQGPSGTVTREAKIELFNDEVQGTDPGWEHGLQFNTCAAQQEGESLKTIRIADKLSGTTSPWLIPEDRSVIPTSPILKKAQLTKDNTVELEWTTSTARNKIDRYEVKIDGIGRAYEPEDGWGRWKYQKWIDPNTTKFIHELPDMKIIPKELDVSHGYFVRTQSNGFISDLRNEKKSWIYPR